MRDLAKSEGDCHFEGGASVTMCFSACVTVAAVMDLHRLHVLLGNAVYRTVSLPHPSASRQKDTELFTEVSAAARGFWI